MEVGKKSEREEEEEEKKVGFLGRRDAVREGKNFSGWICGDEQIEPFPVRQEEEGKSGPERPAKKERNKEREIRITIEQKRRQSSRCVYF